MLYYQRARKAGETEAIRPAYLPAASNYVTIDLEKVKCESYFFLRTIREFMSKKTARDLKKADKQLRDRIRDKQMDGQRGVLSAGAMAWVGYTALAIAYNTYMQKTHGAAAKTVASSDGAGMGNTWVAFMAQYTPKPFVVKTKKTRGLVRGDVYLVKGDNFMVDSSQIVKMTAASA